jgi:Ca2+/H+ antiporter
LENILLSRKLTVQRSIPILLEHVTAVTVSVKDKLNLSLGVAVGSSIVSISNYLRYYAR